MAIETRSFLTLPINCSASGNNTIIPAPGACGSGIQDLEAMAGCSWSCQCCLSGW
jgi:hypothetical protein